MGSTLFSDPPTMLPIKDVIHICTKGNSREWSGKRRYIIYNVRCQSTYLRSGKAASGKAASGKAASGKAASGKAASRMCKLTSNV